MKLERWAGQRGAAWKGAWWRRADEAEVPSLLTSSGGWRGRKSKWKSHPGFEFWKAAFPPSEQWCAADDTGNCNRTQGMLTELNKAQDLRAARVYPISPASFRIWKNKNNLYYLSTSSEKNSTLLITVHWRAPEPHTELNNLYAPF